MNMPEPGTPQRMATLREFLAQSGFYQEGICSRLGFTSRDQLDLAALAERPPSPRRANDALDALIFLFLLGEYLPVGEATSLFPPPVWDALLKTGLVCLDPADHNRCFASVALYPIQNLFVVSDRWSNPDRSPRKSFPDVVYPALTRGATEFLDFTSFEPCESFLEVCAGSAAAALLAAQNAKEVWATDIAERSTRFAMFNLALNDIRNVNVQRGDLFEPVAGRTFDRIAAHPPYMPVLQPAEIYYGGGEDGEEITRRIITELPKYLRPGGRLYCRTLGSDRTGVLFEHRVRHWFGEKQAQFDIALFVLREVELRRFALEETIRKGAGAEELEQWAQIFARHEITSLLTVVLVVQRAMADRPVFTIRRTLRKTTPPAALAWALAWETYLLEGGGALRLAGETPLISPRAELAIGYRFIDGGIVPSALTLSSDQPFPIDCKLQPWMADMLSRCDGKTSIQELFEISKQNQWILAETPLAEFCGLLATMISGGYLLLEKFKWPAATG